MVNNSETLRSLQETSSRHDQTLTSIEDKLAKQEHWNATTQTTLQEMSLLLQNMSAQIGIAASPSATGDLTADSTTHRSKAKVRSTSDDGFPFPPKPVQVELPIFTGEDPEEWIASAQDFFDFYGTDDHHRVTMASFRMTGTAKKWFWWMQQQRQPATVAEYQSRFEDLALHTHNLSDAFLVDCFTSGLRPDIKNEVLSHRSTSMSEVQALARFHEARLQDRRSLGHPPSTKLPPLLPTPAPSPLDTRGHASRPPSSDQHLPSPTSARRISSAEARERRLKGLCYYCDERYAPGHKCKMPQLFSLDDETPEVESPCPTSDQCPVLENSPSSPTFGAENFTVSFNALAGYHTPTTLRVQGTIRGKPVRILIDGGSTHNFIQSCVAKYLGLSVTATPTFNVLVGNGQRLPNEGCARDAAVSVQDTELITDFYILPLEGADVVLGVAWMTTLGPVTMDFSKLTFEFKHGNSQICWQGGKEFGPQQIQLNSLRRLMDTRAIAEFFQLHLEDTKTQSTLELHVDLRELITEFASVFEAAPTLPPPRTTDHAIHLTPASQPVNVRPYRYPYF
ncbi:hypothetical protein HRI_003898200 [Hibiscus trionum]|uniref:Retrotransposon gag domain-containing protein n=1 Tax=Hibiscus trionum TaxID=183268 RepID=A0A9W7MJR8_HIBTR|nr:hypothetical protein HRI_003898200 [Hibiscus trionum]